MQAVIRFAEKHRTRLTRIVAGLVILFILFSRPPWMHGGMTSTLLEGAGIFLVAIAVLGRTWASLYISGYKITTLVHEGPYSMVRHPLYFFSFIGLLGIGLASENLLALVVLALLFVFYYRLVMASEEQELLKVHGAAYEEYMRRVPRFIPKPALYREPEFLQVHTSIQRKTYADVVWFFWALIPLKIIKALQAGGLLPIFFTFP